MSYGYRSMTGILPSCLSNEELTKLHAARFYRDMPPNARSDFDRVSKCNTGWVVPIAAAGIGGMRAQKGHVLSGAIKGALVGLLIEFMIGAAIGGVILARNSKEIY